MADLVDADDEMIGTQLPPPSEQGAEDSGVEAETQEMGDDVSGHVSNDDGNSALEDYEDQDGGDVPADMDMHRIVPEALNIDQEQLPSDGGTGTQIDQEQFGQLDELGEEIRESIEGDRSELGHQAQQHSDVHHTHVQNADADREASTLFVPERETPAPQTPGPTTPARSVAPPTRPLDARRGAAKTSMYNRVRAAQKLIEERKKATAQLHSHTAHHDPDNEAYLEAVMAPIQPSTEAMPVVDEYVMEERKSIAKFEQQKRDYDKLKRENGGRLRFKHQIEWMQIKGAEDSRRMKRARDLAKARDEEAESDLFPNMPLANDDQSNELDNVFDFEPVRSRKRPRETPQKTQTQMSMQDAELESMRVAIQAEADLPRKKKKGKQPDDESAAPGPSKRAGGSKSSSNRTSKSKAAPKKPKGGGNGGGGRKTAKSKRETEHAIKQATSLFNSNVFHQQASADAAEQPGFRSRRKDDALKELIASVPLDHVKKARSDMNTLLNATRDFDGMGAVKSDTKGLWIVKGMATSLKGYQILGSAFMRRRENDIAEPRGGLMADQMGLGKTLMMLANIVNGQPTKGAKGPRTTLLVASPALLTQWKSEIEQHTTMNLRVMRYGGGNRLDSTNAAQIIGSHDIVLTTYNEIMKSYPKNDPPIEYQTAEQKIAWWKEVYETQRGDLHRMIFLRVVLDEAQAIKNHTGRTSIACRALMAHHKWALSGTPILNSLTELYAYFKFLGVPHTGSFKIFKHNYCDTGDAENTERLLVRLSQFMIRRTHADEMFGAPILKLPPAAQTTYLCEFNPVERCIYDIVHNRFAKNINMWAKKGELEKSYSNALVMLLRLRQLTAHVLMLQFVMQDLLEREDIERIKQVVDDHSQNAKDKRGGTILAVRKQLEKLAEVEKKKLDAAAAAKKRKKKDQEQSDNVDNELDNEEPEELDEEDEEPTEDETADPQRRGKGPKSGGQFGKMYNFKPFLAGLNTGESWEKAKRKARCSECGKQPTQPWMTSCGHLICAEPCLEKIDLEAAENGVENAVCKACGVTPRYRFECDPDDDDLPEHVAHGTRAKNKKKQEKQRKRQDREDIHPDWLAAAGDDVLPSAKTIAVKAQILNWITENPNVKIIVYTQFLAMLRILERVCQKEGWPTEQYHGKMSLGARDKAIDTFAKNPATRIMLASLRCGGLGLNLTMASKVIIIDPWWNSASEQQAFCRVFRIGQKEETSMSRMCVRNTVDQRLIDIQERKEAEISSVMEDDGSRLKKMGIRDLMRLFGNLREDNEGKPFILVDNPDPMGGFRADRDDEGYADEF
ncbi:hypothetical protein ACN47E_009347 [Coniothyrium glycines]